MLAAYQDILTRLVAIGVNHTLEVAQQTWSILDFIYDQRGWVGREKRDRVTFSLFSKAGKVEAHIVVIGQNFAKSSGLSRLPSTGNHQDRKALQSLENLSLDISWDVQSTPPYTSLRQ